jgi:hypothetical protein
MFLSSARSQLTRASNPEKIPVVTVTTILHMYGTMLRRVGRPRQLEERDSFEVPVNVEVAQERPIFRLHLNTILRLLII